MIIKVKKIHPLSLAKVLAGIQASIGLIVGIVMLGAMFFQAPAQTLTLSGPISALIFGVGAPLFFLLFYGVIGFVSGLIIAPLYNLFARFWGGLELEVEQRRKEDLL